jgi:hypothetical protein
MFFYPTASAKANPDRHCHCHYGIISGTLRLEIVDSDSPLDSNSLVPSSWTYQPDSSPQRWKLTAPANSSRVSLPNPALVGPVWIDAKYAVGPFS